MIYGILVDVTKCIACEKCVEACSLQLEVDPQKALREKATNRDGLSAYRRSNIVKIEEGRFARKSCMHCLEPSCVSACLVGGITKAPNGPVVYDPDKCIGCRYCMLACPFQVPRYEWDKTSPLMVKCDLCADRVNDGKEPACVEACSEGALIFGERDKLLEEAGRRINETPTRYINHIWGEKEFGGTSVMYVSDVDLNLIGWPETAAVSIPSLTEPLVHTTPIIGMSVAAGLVGLNWIVKRRNKIAREGNSGEKDLQNQENVKDE